MNSNNRQSQHIVYPELTNKDLLYPPLISDTQFPLPSMKEAFKRMQYPGVGHIGHIYSRLSHPTSMHLEFVIARIETVEAGDCLTVASGTSATFYTVMNLCDPGDNMIASLELYGGTMAMFKAFLPSLGIEIRWVDLSDTKALEEAKHGVCLVSCLQTLRT